MLIGAGFTASGMVTLAGAAGGWLAFLSPDGLYVLGAMLIVIGTVIQDVVADAMSTEVVPRTDAAGNARPEDEVRAELGMVQVLGRLALSIGILAVAGLSGWLASIFSRRNSVSDGAGHSRDLDHRRVPQARRSRRTAPDRLAHPRRRHRLRRRGDRSGLGGVPFAQELVFVLSML